MEKKRYEGACHCGRVRFAVRSDLARVTVCNCSICTKKGFVHLIVPPADFELLAGEEHLTVYEFNTKTAKHRFCRVCGIHPFYTPRSDPDKVDVNARCLEGLPDGVESLVTVPFDGQNWEEEMARRSSRK